MFSKIVIKIWLIVKTYSRIYAPIVLNLMAGVPVTPTQGGIGTAIRSVALSVLNFIEAFADLGMNRTAQSTRE